MDIEVLEKKLEKLNKAIELQPNATPALRLHYNNLVLFLANVNK